MAKAVLEERKGIQSQPIEIIENQIVTKEQIVTPVNENGFLIANDKNDIAKVCVFERHRDSGSFSTGFIKGLGLQRGAIGSSIAHDSHNIIVAGMDDESILKVAHRIKSMRGGQVATAGTHEVTLSLPIAGLMSDKTFEEVVDEEKKLTSFCQQALGSHLHRVISTLTFMSLPVIPALKLTDKGIIKILPGEYPQKVSLFVD